MFAGLGATLANGMRYGVALTQRVLDPGFAAAGSHTLTGSGLGTSAVAGGVLQITSTTNVYFERPTYTQGAVMLEAGTYSTVYTVLNYASGSIAVVGASDTAFSVNLVSGTTRSANGTYTENITLATPGWIGLSGKGAAIVDSMQIDNFTITRVS
jgi:hypothetical protein